jgi:hypothetical protein
MQRIILIAAMIAVGAFARAGVAFADQPTDQAPVFSISIQAVDAITQQPVAVIRIVPASADGARTNRTWQSQYRKTYTESPATYSMKRGWEKIDLRIDADGYRPAIVSGLGPKRYEQPRVVELIPDNGPAGRVLQPDGKPAVDAVVAMCTWTNEVMVREGRVSYGSHGEDLRALIQTDSAGRFAIPAEVDEAVIVIGHSTGYAEVLPEELAKSPDVALQAWSRVEGRLVVGGVPVPDQKVSISAGRGDKEVVLHYQNDATSDAAGSFIVERIPPVRLHVSAVFPMGDSARLQTLVLNPVKFEPGTTMRLTLPRKGVPVIGQLKLPSDQALSVKDLEVEAVFARKSYDWKFDFGRTAPSKPIQSPLLPPASSIPVTVQPDGTFRIDSPQEGAYVMHLKATRKGGDQSDEKTAPPLRSMHRIDLPPQDGSDTVLNLGKVEISSPQP